MSEHHDELHEWAGAYALGALDPDDRRRFERHLADCDRCAHEVRVLAPIPGLLSRVEPDELDTTVRTDTADAIARHVQQDQQRLRTSRRRWRTTALASAAALLGVLSAVLVATVGSDESGDDSAVAATVTSSMAESTVVSTTARGWGTEIQLDLAGLPVRDRYQLWAIDVDGTWSTAATWGPTESGRATITGATSVPNGQLGRIVVTSNDRHDIIVDATN